MSMRKFSLSPYESNKESMFINGIDVSIDMSIVCEHYIGWIELDVGNVSEELVAYMSGLGYEYYGSDPVNDGWYVSYKVVTDGWGSEERNCIVVELDVINDALSKGDERYRVVEKL